MFFLLYQGLRWHSHRLIIFHPSFFNAVTAFISLAMVPFVLFSHHSVLVFGLNKITLYKTGGFGAALAYSRKIYRGLSAAFGINYTLNRTALVNKQSINVIAGTKISDSLFGINRHSIDWQYINKSVLLANLELYYAFKKV